MAGNLSRRAGSVPASYWLNCASFARKLLSADSILSLRSLPAMRAFHSEYPPGSVRNFVPAGDASTVVTTHGIVLKQDEGSAAGILHGAHIGHVLANVHHGH